MIGRRRKPLEQRLLSPDVQSEIQEVDTASGVDYWVYLPPLARQASLRQLRELQSRNIDSYIITVGDLANGISLEYFPAKTLQKGSLRACARWIMRRWFESYRECTASTGCA